MSQLDEYPLRLLTCPDARASPIRYSNWNGNDCMILGYIQNQMFAAKIQHIFACANLADTFQSLKEHHEKCRGLT